MNDASLAFFRKLVETPSPSGFEEPVQKVIREWAGQFADEIRTDVHGNVIAVLNPGGSPRVLLDGHCDQIGLLVQYIDDNGYLYVLAIGGWDTQVLLGQRVTVWTQSGPVPGVISRKATHLLKEEERKKVPEMRDLWIDIGCKTRAEAVELVTIGDPVTVALGLNVLRGDVVCGPKMDNSSGLFVVFDALRRLKEMHPTAAIYVVSAVQEEIGLRGAQTAAYGINPHVGVAVDVTHATDCPTIDKMSSGDIRIGNGPVLFRGPNVNPIVFNSIRDLAAKHELPIQLNGLSRGASNDANVLQLTRSGVATGCIGIPNRYMHSPVEVISLNDLDVASELLAHFVAGITPASDFTPR